MSIRASASVIDTASRDLAAAWDRTRAGWNDTKSREFERAWLEKLPPVLQVARRAMEELDALTRKIKHDCE